MIKYNQIHANFIHLSVIVRVELESTCTHLSGINVEKIVITVVRMLIFKRASHNIAWVKVNITMVLICHLVTLKVKVKEKCLGKKAQDNMLKNLIRRLWLMYLYFLIPSRNHLLKITTQLWSQTLVIVIIELQLQEVEQVLNNLIILSITNQINPFLNKEAVVEVL